MNLAQVPTDYFRFCPGEESIKLSNAVCRGRRRSAFPKCVGCQFNDDERETGGPLRSGPAPREDPHVQQVFGARGIFGLTPSPLSADVAWRVGHSTAQFLHGRLRGYERVDPNARSIVVGRDMRPSSPELSQHLIDGIRSVGVDVIDTGIIDTPQLTFAVQRFGACGGVQTTGGARPIDVNGFILCGPKGTAVDENTGLASIRDIAGRVPRHQTGLVARLRSADLTDEYVKFLRHGLNGEARLARDLHVVVDACNGVAARWTETVLGGIDRLKLEVLNAEETPEFAHEPDPRRSEASAALRKRVRQGKADLGVCFSPDAATCAFVDEKSAVVGADLITALLARMLLERHRGAGVVIDLRCGSIVADEIQRAGGVPLRERVGPAFIRKRMAEADAVFGGDLTGRFYFRAGGYCESALLALTHLINLLSATGRSLGDLVRPLLRTRCSGEIRFRCPDVDAALRRLAESHSQAEMEHIDGLSVRYADWWFHARGAESVGLLAITLEARTLKLIDERLAALAPFLGERVD